MDVGASRPFFSGKNYTRKRSGSYCKYCTVCTAGQHTTLCLDPRCLFRELYNAAVVVVGGFRSYSVEDLSDMVFSQPVLCIYLYYLSIYLSTRNPYIDSA